MNARVQPRRSTGRTAKPATAAEREVPQAPDLNLKSLRRLLADSGMTVQQLQGEVLRRGVNTHVRRLLHGGQPSLKLAWASADALGCSIEDLVGEGA